MPGERHIPDLRACLFRIANTPSTQDLSRCEALFLLGEETRKLQKGVLFEAVDKEGKQVTISKDEKALEFFNHALHMDKPTGVEYSAWARFKSAVNYKMSLALLDINEHQAAVEHMKLALEDDPLNCDACLAYSGTLIEAGHYPVELLRGYLRMCRDSDTLVYNFAGRECCAPAGRHSFAGMHDAVYYWCAAVPVPSISRVHR